MSTGNFPNAEEPDAIEAARAKAARNFGAEIARGNYYRKSLFGDAGATRVRLADPVRRMSHLIVTRLLSSAESSRFVEQLFAAVHEAASDVRLIAFEFADYPGFKPTSTDWRELSNHRTMGLRIARYRGATREQEGQWFDLPCAVPWPYFRDVLIPFEVTRRHKEVPGFVQPFHGAIFAPLHHWLQQAFAPQDWCYTAFCADAGTGVLNSNHQDHGGGIVPVTPSIAIVGKEMSGQMKEALRRWDIDLVEAEIPTETEHVDEIFSVLPHAEGKCGRALVVLSPVADDDTDVSASTVASIRRMSRTVCEVLRRKPGLADLRCVELPVRIAGQHTMDFNPVNMLSLPVDDGVVCLLAKPNTTDLEAEYRTTLRRIGETLGYRIETRFIDIRGVAPNHKGSLHCATVELRRG